jgi:hypothetical protein
MELEKGAQFGPATQTDAFISSSKVTVTTKIIEEEPVVVETFNRTKKRAKFIDSIPRRKPFDLNVYIKSEIVALAKKCQEEYALYDDLIEKFAGNMWTEFVYRKVLDGKLTFLQQNAIDDFSSLMTSKGYLCKHSIELNGFKSVLVVTVK